MQLCSYSHQRKRVYIATQFYFRCVGMWRPLFRRRPPLNELAAATRACGCGINHTTRATLHMIMQGEGGSEARARARDRIRRITIRKVICVFLRLFRVARKRAWGPGTPIFNQKTFHFHLPSMFFYNLSRFQNFLTHLRHSVG